MIRGEGSARALVWPGMGAEKRSLHLLELMPGGETRSLKHDSEAVYYVAEGQVVAHDLDIGEAYEVLEGGMIFVEPDTSYVLSCAKVPTRLVGGPCPPDPTLYAGMEEG